MKSSHQLATLLEVFSVQHPVCTAEDLCRALDCSRATGYRHLKALVDEGWLSKVGTGRYALGLRIAQLHGTLLGSHPLLVAGQPALQALAQHCTWPLSLTCAYGHEQLLDVLYTTGAHQPLLHGRPRAQWACAAGCLWLASRPATAQQRHYTAHRAAFTTQAWGADWDAWHAHAHSVAQHACSTWHAPGSPGLTGVAVPVFNPEGQLVATVSAEASDATDTLPLDALPALQQQLHDTAWAIRKALAGTPSALVM